MTIHIDRDPEPETPEPTEQTLRAQHVLESLDSMRTSGATIEDQVRYLNQNLPSTPKEMEEPPTISEQLALQERLKGEFSRLRQAMVGLMTTWNTPDILPDDVRSAGYRLLKHLDTMRQAAEENLTKNWKSEIGMLSEVWESAPDVSAVFGITPPRAPRGLASQKPWKTPHVKETQPYAPHHARMAKFKEAIRTPEFAQKVQEAVTKADARSKEKAEARRVPHKILHEPLGKNPDVQEALKELATPESQALDAMAETLHKAALSDPKLAEKIEVRESHDQKLVKELEGAGTVVGDPSKIKIKFPPLEIEPTTQLTIDTWTAALNEHASPKDLDDSWVFLEERQGVTHPEQYPTTMLVWNANGCQTLLKRRSVLEGTWVELGIYKNGVVHTSAKLLKTADEVNALDCDPETMIRATLNAPTK